MYYGHLAQKHLRQIDLFYDQYYILLTLFFLVVSVPTSGDVTPTVLITLFIKYLFRGCTSGAVQNFVYFQVRPLDKTQKLITFFDIFCASESCCLLLPSAHARQHPTIFFFYFYESLNKSISFLNINLNCQFFFEHYLTVLTFP